MLRIASVAFAALASVACADVPVFQRNTLRQWYLAASGDQWTLASGWTSDMPVCGWFGVACDAYNATITAIQLPNNNIAGTLSLNFSSMPELEYVAAPLFVLTVSLPCPKPAPYSRLRGRIWGHPSLC